MVELLCQAGVPPKVNNGWAWTLKPWESRLPMLHNLLAARAHPVSFIADKEPGFPLVNAAQEGSLLAVQLLLNAGAPINITMPQYYGTALQAACWGDNLELARYLIEYGADTNIPHALPSSVCHRKSLTPLEYMALQTPIQIAAKRNNVRLVELLLQRGANANACPLFAHPDVELLSSYKPRRGAVYENSYRPRYKSQDYIQTSIQYAAINKNVEMVGLLLAQGVDPDSRVVPCLGDTALQISARLGNPEIFQLLISSGADVNATPGAHNGRTALQGAAESGNFEILSILGSLGVVGASINAPAGEELGMTALQAACLNGHSLFMGILLAHGADVNAAPSSVAGCTTVQAASWSGKIDIIRDLIELGASVGTRDNVLGTTALLASMEHQSLPILELLVTHGADVNELADGDLYTPIQKAAEYSWLKGVEFLLESGSNVNEVTIPAGKKVFGDESALGLAITNDADQVIDAQKMVTLLLEHGADVWGPAKVVGSHSIKTESSLIHALEQNPTLEVIHLLLAKVPELERHPGWAKALELAFRYCREDVTELILERTLSMPPSARLEVMKKAWDSLPDFSHMDSEQMLERITDLVIYERPLDGSAGLFINGRAPDGSTLLQRSCWAGFHEALPTLIRYGADVHTDATECHGTPLQEALKSKDVKSAYILLQHNVDINASSAKKDGVTALQAAAMNGLFTMAIRLLESGADVAATATPIGGRTAIDGAAERGRWDMVQMLSNAYEAQGLDVGQVSRQAAEHAEREEHTELAEWLRGYPPS
jgi:ankyrin repeat protein